MPVNKILTKTFLPMKKIKLTAAAFITLLAATVLVTGCEKKSDAETPQDEVVAIQLSSEADAEAEVLYNEIFDNVIGVEGEIGVGAGIGIFRTTDPSEAYEIGQIDTAGNRCFTVTTTPMQPGVFPKTVTLDFGNGCLGRDGRVRRGKVITVYTGRMSVAGSSATTTFNNHFVDSIKIEGTHTVENVSTSNNRSFRVKLVNGRLTRPNGTYVLHAKDKTWIQTAGNGTPHSPVDDEFAITGTASGSLPIGTNVHTWSTTIIQPVVRRFTCRWPVQGKVEMNRNNRTIVLDYGNGTCDNKATVLINGTTHIIVIR